MRVVFLEDVSGVAQGGEVKEVKNGFARNHLIPKNLAVPATHNALQRVKRLRKQADETRVQRMADLRALAELLDGVQVDVEMRAGSGGRLYGSVTSAMLADKLSAVVGGEIDRRTVVIAEPIRELGTFDVRVRLDADVEAGVKVLVYAAGTDPTDMEEPDEAEEPAETDDAEDAAYKDELGETEGGEPGPTEVESGETGAPEAQGDADDAADTEDETVGG